MSVPPTFSVQNYNKFSKYSNIFPKIVIISLFCSKKQPASRNLQAISSQSANGISASPLCVSATPPRRRKPAP
jgi:hypothetical protein